MPDARARSVAPGYAVPDSEIERLLSEIATPLASVPEGARLPYWRALERWARTSHGERERYNPRKLSAAAMKIAAVVWAEWPPQEPES
jgi:hypothetical protein